MDSAEDWDTFADDPLDDEIQQHLLPLGDNKELLSTFVDSAVPSTGTEKAKVIATRGSAPKKCFEEKEDRGGGFIKMKNERRSSRKR